MIAPRMHFTLVLFSLLAFASLQLTFGGAVPPISSTTEQEEDVKARDEEQGSDLRIVGGFEARENEFPWMVGLWTRDGDHPFCAGSLLLTKWVLTAAQCVDDRYPDDIEAIFGDHDVTQDEYGEQHIKICKIHSHPDFPGQSGYDNDIALLELCRPVRNTYAVQSLLPAVNTLPSISRVMVAGWGATEEDGDYSNVLRAVSLWTVSRRECRRAYNDIGDGQICAGVRGGGKDACVGDAGAPLWYRDPESGAFAAVGVVSSGYGCARAGYPGIYTRVSHYADWLMEIVFPDDAECDDECTKYKEMIKE